METEVLSKHSNVSGMKEDLYSDMRILEAPWICALCFYTGGDATLLDLSV